jgi:PTS system nitrogen regulatory IIA component
MLTAKRIQELLQVDRSTIYRMAEVGQLPAIKVGKQWRFPADQIERWFQAGITKSAMPAVTAASHSSAPARNSRELTELLPLKWLQAIQETFAHLLGVMLVVTDMEGNPVVQPSNPCPLFTVISQQPNAMQKFSRSWRDLATTTDLTPKFIVGHLGLLCARSVIGVGTELKGMVIAGCIAPVEWPPSPAKTEAIASKFGVEPEFLLEHIDAVLFLEEGQQAQVLATLPRIATIIAHTVNERKRLIGRLEAIAGLAQPYGG